MNLGRIIFGAVGAYLVFQGFTADYLIDESEVPATPEEKEKAKATPLTRLLVVCAGIGAVIYAVFGNILHKVVPLR